MSRRATGGDSGSLDLLLDTITNTLGGVLFLAILLVLMTKASKAIVREDRHAPDRDTAEIEAAIELAESRVDRLERERDLVDALSASLARPEDRPRLAEMAAMREEVATLDAESERAEQELRGLDVERDRLAASKETFEDALDQERLRHAELTRRLRAEKESRTEDLPLPRERAARRRFFDVVLRYGRLYFVRASAPGDADSPNLDDFFDLETDGGFVGRKYRVITPKPFRGAPVLANGRLTPQARAAILRWPAGRYYATVSVWDDSFAEMRAMRQLFAAEGYEYRLLPVTDGDEIVESSVPNPRVQ